MIGAQRGDFYTAHKVPPARLEARLGQGILPAGLEIPAADYCMALQSEAGGNNFAG